MNSLIKRIYDLLLPRERKTLRKVVWSVFCGSLLDFISLATLLPVLYLLLEGGDSDKAALLFGIIAICVVLMKWLINSRIGSFRSRFMLGLYKRLSLSLYSSYYKKGLLFIRDKGMSRLGYEVNQMCYSFSQNLLAPLARMAGDALLIILVVVALVVYSPLTAFILCLSFVPFVLIYVLVIREKSMIYGKREQDAKREQQQLVNDTFGGYAELRVSGAFDMLQSAFSDGMDEISINRLKMEKLMRLPMPLSELAVTVGLVLLAASSGGDVSLLLGIFAISAFRLLPAMRSILTGWTVVQNASYCLDILEKGLSGEDAENKEYSIPIVFEKEILFENVTYSYPDGEKIFNDFNVKIEKGEYVGFCGYSGVGKSTLFNLLLGFLEPVDGKVKIDGISLSGSTQTDWLSRVGYVPQEVFIFNGSLAENIALGSEYVDRKRINILLKQMSLEEWVNSLSKGIDTTMGERGGKLSGGQRQRIGIARALYRRNDVLLLDEATSALDNQTEKEINETLCSLREKYPSLTILSIAHRESSLAYCDRVIHIN